MEIIVGKTLMFVYSLFILSSLNIESKSYIIRYNLNLLKG